MDKHSVFKRAIRIEAVEISAIVQLTERANELKAKGRDLIALTTGEPDFQTPDHVVEAAHQAALSGKTRYPPTAGTAELRHAIAAKSGAKESHVIVSTGAKQVLANAMLASLNICDEVIMPAPYWTSYSDIVTLAGGQSVVVACSMAEDFKLSPQALEHAITEKTRWIMLNTPSNPAGVMYTAQELRALADVLARYPKILILLDEIYEHLSYTQFSSLSEVAPELSNRTLRVNGVSKAYAMTGWRIGWGIGPSDMISAMAAVQGQITSGASSLSQAAALAALEGDQRLLEIRRDILIGRRNKVVAALNAIDGVVCPRPEGAFYVFPDVTAAMKRLGHATDTELCAHLMEHAGVVIVPGYAFGLPGHIRLSFAYSDAALDEGLRRITAYLTDAVATPAAGNSTAN